MLDNRRPAFGEIYSAYAAGCLDPAFMLLVETQAALRPEIARALAKGDAITGVFLETEDSAALADDALSKALDAIDDFEETQSVQRAAARRAGTAIDELLALPQPLRDTVLETCADRSWQKLTNGVQRLSLNIESAAEVELYRIEPDQTVPRHSHRGNEYTLVVAGGFSDKSGHFGPGDLAVNGPQHTHQPTGDSDGVCFALAVRDDGLEFTGVLGAVQRILGR
ncbi:MAG: ChrR family anti-sigma-E factor [Pseudomonadota bacterium]